MLIDPHCHIPHKNYEKSVEDIIREAEKEGVLKFIAIGTSIKESNLVKDISLKYDPIYYSVAIYPHEEMHTDLKESLAILEDTFLVKKDKKLVAIGECGIDISNWQGGRDIKDQVFLFEEQIKLAIKYDLPLIIHDRKGDEFVLELLNKYVPQGLRGVIHCFDSTWDFAKQVLDLGFYLSFSGMITYPKKEYLLDVIRQVPIDKFLVETDAPYLAPQGHRGEVNYSKYVKMVAEKFAEVRRLDLKDVEKFSYDNTSKLFNL